MMINGDVHIGIHRQTVNQLISSTQRVKQQTTNRMREGRLDLGSKTTVVRICRKERHAAHRLDCCYTFRAKGSSSWPHRLELSVLCQQVDELEKDVCYWNYF